MHTYLCLSGVENFSFSKNFVHTLINGLSCVVAIPSWEIHIQGSKSKALNKYAECLAGAVQSQDFLFGVFVFDNKRVFSVRVGTLASPSYSKLNKETGFFMSFCTAWTQAAFTCSKLTIKTLEQGEKYV